MAMSVWTFCVCVITLVLSGFWATSKCFAQEQTLSAFITIAPTTLTLEHNLTSSGDVVTIRCTGTVDDAAPLYSLKLSRVLNTHPNATPTTLLSILHHNLNPQVIYPIEGASSFGSVTQNFLTLRMESTQCEDAGVYICEAAYLYNDVIAYTANDTLSVTVNPGQLTVTSVPDFENWAVNNTVTLTCSGALGTADLDSQLDWHWEFWDKNSNIWRSYDGPASDVTTQDTNQQPCYENGTSVLTRRLQAADSERNYRCYVKRDNVPFHQHAGRFQFGYVVSATALAEAADNYEVGMAVGAGIGVAATVTVVVLVVVVVIMCLWKRRLLCTGGGTKDSISTASSSLHRKRGKTKSVAMQTVIADDAYDVIDDAVPTTTAPPPPTATTPRDNNVDYETVIDLATAQRQKVAAEDVLHTLLATRHVMSWKVSGEAGGHTSFLLRLSPTTNDVTYLGMQQGRWRKKTGATRPKRQQGRHRVAMPQDGAEHLALPEVPSLDYESPRR